MSELVGRVEGIIQELDNAKKHPLSDRRPGYMQRCRDALQACRDELTKQAEHLAECIRSHQKVNAEVEELEAKLDKQSERVRELEAAVSKLRYTEHGQCRGCGVHDYEGECEPDCNYLRLLKGTDQ